MGKLTKLKLDKAYMAGTSVPAWDPNYGGQQGWASNIAEFKSNQAHKTSPLICVMLEAPKAFSVIPGGNKYIESLKAIMELHSLSISGFNESITVDTDQHAVGGAGQMQQEVVNTTREQPTPQHTFVDKYGRPIQRLLNFWIRYLLMDPDSKFPLAPVVGDAKIRDMGPDMYSMTCLYFEPDITMTGINRAWLVVNMFPLTDGDGTSQRDLTQGQQLLNLDISFSGLAQVGYGVHQLALAILKNINSINADSYFREAAVKEVDPDVRAAGDSDYKKSVENTGKQAVFSVGI